MPRKIANRAKLPFVKKFLKHWKHCNLHEPTKNTKTHRFKKFVRLMREDGEYLEFHPTYLPCYNFFRDLNPKKWKKAKQKELKSLETELSQLFESKEERNQENLLESCLTFQYTYSDEKRGADLYLKNIFNSKQKPADTTTAHEQIIKNLDQITEEQQQNQGVLSKQIKKELWKKYSQM